MILDIGSNYHCIGLESGRDFVTARTIHSCRPLSQQSRVHGICNIFKCVCVYLVSHILQTQSIRFLVCHNEIADIYFISFRTISLTRSIHVEMSTIKNTIELALSRNMPTTHTYGHCLVPSLSIYSSCRLSSYFLFAYA